MNNFLRKDAILSIFVLLVFAGVIAATANAPTQGGNLDNWGTALNSWVGTTINTTGGYLNTLSVNSSDMVGANVINTSHIVAAGLGAAAHAPLSINTTHIALSNITAGLIAPSSINITHLLNVTGLLWAFNASYLNFSSVNGSILAQQSINGTHILAGSINGTHIQASTINGSHILALAINTTHIALSNITAGLIAPSAVNATHILAGSINGTDIQASTINGSHILALAINTTHIALSNITAGLIAPGAVNTTHILDGGITAADYAIASINASHWANTSGIGVSGLNVSGTTGNLTNTTLMTKMKIVTGVTQTISANSTQVLDGDVKLTSIILLTLGANASPSVPYPCQVANMSLGAFNVTCYTNGSGYTGGNPVAPFMFNYMLINPN